MTENQLWQALTRYPCKGLELTRIETSIRLGVSDIEYVGANAHGWVEMKVARQPSARILDRPVRLQHPLTTEQSVWLLGHDRPRIQLVSWLLIGLFDVGWDAFLLVRPIIIPLLNSRRGITWRELREHPDAYELVHALDVLNQINQGVPK